jgi:hypothetical protein
VLTGKSGTPSTLSAPTITTITAVGGGGGATSASVIPNQAGISGGSGGGGFTVGPGTQPAQNPANPAVTSQLGNPGGAFNPSTRPTIGAGGGGAGGPGSVGNPGVAGGGGAGYNWPHTGTTYAYGGNSSAIAYNVVSNGSNGTIGLGNGGQISTGFNPTSGSGGTGGSGVIILMIPTAAYPSVTAPGATVTTPPAAPGNTLLTYTTSSLTVPATYTFIA